MESLMRLALGGRRGRLITEQDKAEAIILLQEACNAQTFILVVKRLHLFMADKANLPVMKHLKLDNVDLGKGDRSIVQHGQYNAKYGLTLPKELLNYDKPSL